MESYWVFAYGSLMWRPGFAFEEGYPALLHGAHRSLCVFSHVHRGTPQRPGLVLGLDRGGACRGVAFRVAPHRWEETVSYLRVREQATAVYLEVRRRVTLMGAGRQGVSALCFLVDRRHPQYAGRLPATEQAKLVLQGFGVSGANPDYVLSTVAHLRQLGIHDSELEALASLVATAARLTEVEATLPAAVER
jgi:glutathione-specific gamma-glutamylcyclotransferase